MATHEGSIRKEKTFEAIAAVFGAAPIADYDRQLTGFTKCWREQVGGPSNRRENCIIRSIISFSNCCFGVRLSSDGSRTETRADLGVAVAILHTLQSVFAAR